MLRRLHRQQTRPARAPRSLLGALALFAFLPLATAAQPYCQVQQARDAYGVEIVTDGQSWDDASLNTVLDALSRLPPHVVTAVGQPDLRHDCTSSPTRNRSSLSGAEGLLQRRQLLLE